MPLTLAAFALILLLSGQLTAQLADLTQYAGVYRYHAGGTIAIVPERVGSGERLVAILGPAKYALRTLGNDRFLNGVGDTIPFARDERGAVSQFTERGKAFSRLSAVVPDSSLLLTIPRPPHSLAAVYHTPAELNDGLAVGSMGQTSIDTSTLTAMIRGVLDRTYNDVHSVLLYSRGKLMLEEYFYGYDAARTHELRSATKSVISLLAGVAIDRKAIPDEDAPAWPLLGVAPPRATENFDRSKITLRDLLTMRTGLACDDWNAASPGNESKVYETADWIATLAALPMIAEPGSETRYCSAGSIAVGRAVERSVGRPLLEFARDALFAPLGVSPSAIQWNFTLTSANAATFSQISMRPRDMLKLGVLVLNHGRWQGRQVISADWIDRSTARHTAIGSTGYGYLWWHQSFDVATSAGKRRVDTIRASGNGGQKIFIIPSLEAVVVFTGGAYNSDRDTAPNEMMPRHILPALLASPRSQARLNTSVDVILRSSPFSVILRSPLLFCHPEELSPLLSS
jgi:CubicO group peptidase (beta-lactamase class C family)